MAGMQWQGKQGYRSPIARRLVVYVVLFSSLITLVASAWQLWRIYLGDRTQIVEQLAQIEKAYMGSIAEGLWAADREGLQTLLKGVASIRDISYIEIREHGKTWLKSGVPEPVSDRRIVIQRPVVYHHRGRSLQIGSLVVHASLQRAYRDVINRVWNILVSNAIKTFLVSGLLLLLFGRLVTRHLHRIADHADQLAPDSLQRPLHLDRRQARGGRDELDLVTDAFNRMQGNLRETLRRLEEHAVRWQYVSGLGLGLSGKPDEVFGQLAAMLGEMFRAPFVFLAELQEQKLIFKGVHNDDVVHMVADDAPRPLPAMFRHLEPADDGRICDQPVDATTLAFLHGLDKGYLNACPAFGHDGKAVVIIGLVSLEPLSLSQVDIDFLRICAQRAAVELELERDQKQQSRLRLQLQYAQKMESLGMLAGGIAHDFNNVLASIMGYTSLAIERETDEGDEKTLSYLEQVLKAGERARDLITQMLIFSRGRIEDSEPVRLAPLLKEVGRMLRSMIPANIDIRMEIEEDDARVAVDPVSLHQLVMNLCVNARDAIHERGSIRIKSQRSRHQRGSCHSCGQAFEGDFIKLSVCDNGEGIPGEVLQRIFEPFFTTKDVGKGTGMGLSMVHSIVHHCDGHIVVDSEPGAGACFNLLFPPAAGVADEDSEARQDKIPVRDIGIGRHALIVDDESSVARFLSELMRNWGFETTVMTNSEEALALLQSRPTAFDILVTDQTMPGMTGAVLAGHVAAINPSLPVVLCTGNTDPVDGLEKPADHWCVLQKPVDIHRLSEVLQSVLP